MPNVYRKLKEWIVDCLKKKKQLTRTLVWEEAMKYEPTMFGGYCRFFFLMILFFLHTMILIFFSILLFLLYTII